MTRERVRSSAFVRAGVLGLAAAFIASACSLTGASAPQVATQAVRPTLSSSLPSAAPAETLTPTPATVSETSTGTSGETASGRSVSARTTKPAAPRVRTVKLRPRPKPGPFAINLYRKGDFMHQQTKDWCVAGSTQTMMNIIDDGKPNRSAAFQKKLYFEGRRLSHNQQKLGAIGVDLTGWADLLNTRGYGPYKVDGGRTRRQAIRMAAKALRTTGKPVGLVTWRGAHSWVMSGFIATADPAYTDDFVIKKVYIQDTWYPYVSTIWGASRPPDAAVPVAALAEDFLPYRRPSARYPKRDGKYMLILPTLPKGTIAR